MESTSADKAERRQMLLLFVLMLIIIVIVCLVSSQLIRNVDMKSHESGIRVEPLTTQNPD